MSQDTLNNTEISKGNEEGSKMAIEVVDVYRSLPSTFPAITSISHQQQTRVRNNNAVEICQTTPSAIISSNNQQLQVKPPKNIERMFETFHQSPHGNFRPTFYNPFEVKHRRRTTRDQFKVLEKAFQENSKPPASHRKVLASRLGMTPRAVQVWFQNRRAKLKTVQTKQQIPSLARSSSDVSLQTCHDERTSPQMTCSGEDVNEDSDHGDSGIQDEEIEHSFRSRSNSCPNIELPFKQLQDALFGSYIQVSSSSTIAPKTNRSKSIPCHKSSSTNGYHGPYPASTVFSCPPPSSLLEPIMEDPVHPIPHSYSTTVRTSAYHHPTVPIAIHQQASGDPVDFDYLIQSSFGGIMAPLDQWLYYPSHHQVPINVSISNNIQNATPSQNVGSADAFLMSFVEDTSFEE